MTTPTEEQFVYFEAKPKRGRQEVVNQTITSIAALFAEIFDKHRRNCTFHPEKKGAMWTVFIAFESEEARDLLVEDPRFQELITDIRAYCKPAHRMRRMLYSIFHPGKRLGVILDAPVGFSNK